MEKDYFKDRPESIQFNKNVYKGCIVFICLKNMQKHAKEISDLTMVNITGNLTSQYQHPRGQKIKGYIIKYDKYGNTLIDDEKDEVIGRCTYLLDNNCWSLDTKDGKKFLLYNESTKKLELKDYLEVKGKMKIFCKLTINDIVFRIPLFKYRYFDSIEEASSFINEINLLNIEYRQGKITFQIDDNYLFENSFEIYKDNIRIKDELLIFKYLCANDYDNTTYYNKTFALNIKDFELEKIL